MKLKHQVTPLRKLLPCGTALALALAIQSADAAGLAIVETNDFSDNILDVTQITPVLEPGTNVIQGAVDGNTFAYDEDFFRVTLPPGYSLAGLTLKITNYSAEPGNFGMFEVHPNEEGNSGSFPFVGNMEQAVAFVIGAPDNIILSVTAPFAGLGQVTSANYEITLVVQPVQVVDGTSIRKAVEITFPSEAGQSYQLQCTTDVNSGDWVNVGAPITGVGGTMSAFDTARSVQQCFYRVVKN